MCVHPQEVITHEHVVSMMKAAIRDTQDQPMFVSHLSLSPAPSLTPSLFLSPSLSLFLSPLSPSPPHPLSLFLSLPPDCLLLVC